MSRTIVTLSMALGLAVGAMAREVVLIDENFESGLDAWTAKVKPSTISVYNDDPLVFDSAGVSSDGTPIYGANANYPPADDPGDTNDQTGGFSSDLTLHDGTSVWMQRQFPNAVEPGTYTVVFTGDVYVYSSNTDPWGTGNRVYLLTDAYYDDPSWNFDGPDPNGLSPPKGFRKSYWPGDSSWSLNGVWRRNQTLTPANPITTTTGNIEVRLLFHDKYAKSETIAWDNLTWTLYDTSTGRPVWTVSEDFEDGWDGWTRTYYPWHDPNRPNNDTPTVFAPDDPLLYANNNNPGSQSVGYSSNLEYEDLTRAAWLQMQLPGALPAGGPYDIRLECDWYVYWYGVPPGDPWGVGNRIYLLTDNQYNNPDLNFDSNDAGFYEPGFRDEIWPGSPWVAGQPTYQANGVWQRRGIERPLSTTTGDLELRLLLHDKYAGRPQAVAWDNVKLTLILPCNAPRFDVDGDGDVDHLDFGAFQLCYSGEGVTYTEDCRCFDSDADKDIDSVDLRAFEECASGPGVAANPDCDSVLPPP